MNIRLASLILFILLAVTACTGSLTPAPPFPTVETTPTADPFRSAKVVQAFWDALEAGDVETAMTYVADKISCRGFCYFDGKETFQTYLQGYIDGGYMTKISDLKNVGNIVTYSWEVYRSGLFVRRGDEDEMMEVEDGKIIYWENRHQ